ncbi:uncharacterized protein J5F26_010259 [Ciconia maguari]
MKSSSFLEIFLASRDMVYGQVKSSFVYEATCVTVFCSQNILQFCFQAAGLSGWSCAHLGLQSKSFHCSPIACPLTENVVPLIQVQVILAYPVGRVTVKKKRERER